MEEMNRRRESADSWWTLTVMGKRSEDPSDQRNVLATLRQESESIARRLLGLRVVFKTSGLSVFQISSGGTVSNAFSRSRIARCKS